jgi:hypothetical protein
MLSGPVCSTLIWAGLSSPGDWASGCILDPETMRPGARKQYKFSCPYDVVRSHYAQRGKDQLPSLVTSLPRCNVQAQRNAS